VNACPEHSRYGTCFACTLVGLEALEARRLAREQLGELEAIAERTGSVLAGELAPRLEILRRCLESRHPVDP